MADHKAVVSGVPFDPAAVSSLAAQVAAVTGGLTAVRPGELPLWLPGLRTPPDWVVDSIDNATATRVLTRRVHETHRWDGIETLNLYRVPGQIPEQLVLDNADRILRDAAATDIRSSRFPTPAHPNVIVTRAVGVLDIGPRRVYSHVNHCAVNSAAGGALIEQTVMVGADAFGTLAEDVLTLSDGVLAALLSSVSVARQV